MRWFYPLWSASVAGSVLLGCVPDVGDSDTRISAPRVLALRADPAEAEPRDKLKFSALYVGRDGTLPQANLDWGLCLARKSLAELGPISRACLVEKGASVEAIGQGLSASAALSKDACRLFGPDQPPATEDEPAGRPVDPDVTGGYYQPVRVFDDDEGRYATFDARIACDLPRVTQQQFAEFNTRYRRNHNPEVASLAVVSAERAHALVPASDGAPYAVKRGQHVALRVTWAACSRGNSCDDGICGDQEDRMSCRQDCVAMKGCTGSEHYLYFDTAARAFSMRRESMRVSWFSTAGSFGDASTGRSEAEADMTDSDNTWIAPDATGEVTLWVVLRDDRGGVAWQTYRFAVGR